MATACLPGQDTAHDHLPSDLYVTPPCSPEEIFPEARCPVCEGPVRLPKLLDCLHSVCEPCVKRCLSASEHGAVVVCPLKDCGEQTSIPQGLTSALPTNYLLLSSQQLNSRTCLCCECVDEEEAESYCEECGVFLCLFHALSHRKSRSTAQHTLQEIDRENAASLRGPQQRRIPCPFHGENMSLFCRTCDYLCCSQCTRGVHREHIVELTSEVSAAVMADFREKLMEIMTATDGDERTVEQLIEESNQMLNEIEDQAKATSKQITARIGEVKRALEEKERCLLQRVDTLKNHRECELEQSLEYLQKTSLTFKIAVETAEKVLVHLAYGEQLSLAPVLRRRLLQAQTDIANSKKTAAKIIQRDERIEVSSTALSSEAVVERIEESFCVDEIRSDARLVNVWHTSVAALNHTNRFGITCRNSCKKTLSGDTSELGLDLSVVMPSGKPLSLSIKVESYPGKEIVSTTSDGVEPATDAVMSHQVQDWHEEPLANSDQKTSEEESIDEATHYVYFEPEEVGLHTVRLNYEEGKQDGTVLHRFMIVDIPAMQFASLTHRGLVTSDGRVMTCKVSRVVGSAIFWGDVFSTSGVMSWRLQVSGLSAPSGHGISIGAHGLDVTLKKDLCWLLNCSTRAVNVSSTDHHTTAYIHPTGNHCPKLRDGDILFCWLYWPKSELWITHEASGVSVVFADMSLTSSEVVPAVMMSSPKHRVVSLPPGLLNEEISDYIDDIDS